MTESVPARSDAMAEPVTGNPWRVLRAFTDARIGLGRAGVSVPTDRLLEFELAHARARDAVNLPLDAGSLCRQLTDATGHDPVRLHSQAANRITYLQRPDLGRQLDQPSRQRLQAVNRQAQSPDLAIVIVDGLSSYAIQNNTVPLLRALLPALELDDAPWQLAPLTVVEQGRVAIGDEIGSLLDASAVLVLVGERPGLSSPDSLGIYLTWNPRPGRTDADRNCISNVRPAGLSAAEAAHRILYLLGEARRRGLSGVRLKDRSGSSGPAIADRSGNFLVE